MAEGDIYIGIEYIDGTIGNDTIVGSSGENRLQGLEGDDTLTGLGGDDDLRGGEGATTFVYRGNFDEYFVSSSYIRHIEPTDDIDDGNDYIEWQSGSSLQFADTDVNLVKLEDQEPFTGTFGRDLVQGTIGDDTITGGHSDDILSGSAGDDTAVFRYIKSQYELSIDYVSNGFGFAPTLISEYVGPWSGDGTDTLFDFETLQFRDTSVDVEFTDDEGGWTFGTGGDEIIFGGNGNDNIRGAAGDDLLSGGSGIDAAVFRYNKSDYDIYRVGDVVHVDYVGPWYGDGIDQLVLFETLHFKDQAMFVSDVPFA